MTNELTDYEMIKKVMERFADKVNKASNDLVICGAQETTICLSYQDMLGTYKQVTYYFDDNKNLWTMECAKRMENAGSIAFK